MEARPLMGILDALRSISTEDKTLFGLLVTNLIGTLSLVVMHLLKYRREERLYGLKVQLDTRVSLVREQLSQLYGPIDAILMRNRAILDRMKGGDAVLKDYQQNLVREVILPGNKQIVSLISEKMHLCTESPIPPCWAEFLVHAEWLRLNERDGSVPSNIFPFPKAFAEDIEKTTMRLKAELSEQPT